MDQEQDGAEMEQDSKFIQKQHMETMETKTFDLQKRFKQSNQLSNISIESGLSEKTEKIKARTILWYLSFIGFALNYMIRINVNIAIVDMIKTRRMSNRNHQASYECYIYSNITHTLTNTSTMILVEENSSTRFSFERLILTYLNIDYNENGFEWNEHEQELLLGAFFWLAWVSTIPGGLMSRKYGTKIVFGLGNLLGCLICALMPMAAFIDIRILIFLRVVQGIIVGVVWPSMFDMVAQWIPPNERSTFASSYMGSSVGVALFSPLFGFIIEESTWEWVFHICALCGIIWFVAWTYFVYDSPALHPRIEQSEREYIEKSLGKNNQQRSKLSIPWKDIIKSGPVWIVMIAFVSGGWILFTLMTQAPIYFKLIHGWHVGMIGLLSGLPHATRMVFSYFFSKYCDFLMSTNKLSRTNVRKLASLVCHVFSGLSTIGLAYSGCNSTLAVIFFTIAITTTGAVSAGPIAATSDLTPNFSSIISGMSINMAMISGFISPIIVGELTLNNQTTEQWKYVFLIAGFLAIIAGGLYVSFSSSELQDWNNAKHGIKNQTSDEYDKFIITNQNQFENGQRTLK